MIAMKATLKGKITAVNKPEEGDAEITFVSSGKVDRGAGPMDPSARQMKMNGSMTLKAVIANELKLGAILTITLSDEEPDDRLD